MERLKSLFEAAHRQIRPRTEVPVIHVGFYPYAGLNHTARLVDGVLNVRMSDMLADAPGEVLAAVAFILTARLYRRRVDPVYHRIYREFTVSEPILLKLKLTIPQRGRIARIRPSGRFRNLQLMFDVLNDRYFGGQLPRPELSWSARPTRYILGRYDSARHAIFLSRFLDSPAVPDYVAEFVLYHEMLHIQHPVRFRNSRRTIHPPELRRDERRFEQFLEAQAWLKRSGSTFA